MPGVSRRELFTFWRRRERPVPRLRPPGALDDEDAFFDACTRCGECTTACPRRAIFPDDDGVPQILPRRAPCVACNDVLCTKVCPTPALRKLAAPSEIFMGVARVLDATCTAYWGGKCHQCVDACPAPGALVAVTTGPFVIPRVDADKCIGCGMCENVCPTEPASIVVTPKHAL